MDSMYEQLMGLPLFSGVSHQKISEIIGKYPFHFLKFSDGETIISHGEPCTHLLSVIAGEISTEIISSDGKFRSTQTLAAPDTISPEFLFGRSTLSPLTAVAKGAAGIVRIAKPDFLQILTSPEGPGSYTYNRIWDENLLKALASIESIYPYTLYTIRNDYTR